MSRAGLLIRTASIDPAARRNKRNALSRRRLMTALGLSAMAAVSPTRVFALGERSQLRFARLALPALPNPRPSAVQRLVWEVRRRTSLEASPELVDVRPGDAELFRHPFLLLTGDRGFAQPADHDVIRLRRYLTYGGFLLVDSAEGRAGGRFDEAVRALLQRVLPGDLPTRVSPDHVLWKSFYLLHGPAGRVAAAPYLEAVERDRRLAVVYTQNDLMGALARDGYGRWEYDVVPGGESQREQAFRLAVNIVMYAFCLDYKSEQAHIDHILRTRRRR